MKSESATTGTGNAVPNTQTPRKHSSETGVHSRPNRINPVNRRLLSANAKLVGKRVAAEQGSAAPIGESIQNLIGLCRESDPLGLIEQSHVPRRHCRLDAAHERHAEWAGNRDRLCKKLGSGFLIALIGNRGTGKTQMAVHAVALNAKAYRTSFYCKAMEIFLRIRATYTRTDIAELDAIEEFLRPQLLVIDEIQQRGETLFEDRILAYLIDKRYDAMTDTILIGNLEEQALREALDPSITDRLRETGGIIECTWESFREPKPIQNGAQEQRI